MDAIFKPPSEDEVSAVLQARMKARLAEMGDDDAYRYLADAVYLERKRFSRARDKDTVEARLIESGARALRKDRKAWERVLGKLVDTYAHEIHNPFSSRTYDVAIRVVPAALGRLLTASGPKDLIGSFDPRNRIVVSGETKLVKALSKKATLILAPTHVSNLDSPLIGWAINETGLPPFIYGAGLNLFSNPAMAFFMSRLGAYTVDRRKRHALYKDVLKDYSVDALSRRHHSLFYPGGTRSRSGEVETRLKKGLLGTGLEAWQDALEAGRDDGDVLVVPCTLSCALVLEAETLIEDHLAEVGKSRYIISDDEFADSRKVASFTSRVLNLDASVHIRLGRPLDLMGNLVDDDGRSLDPNGNTVDRVGYITDKSGELVRDRQRDKVYTDRLAESICAAYQRDNTVLSTHLVARAAWSLLCRDNPRLDIYQLMLLSPDERTVERQALLTGVQHLRQKVDRLEKSGALQAALPRDAEAALDDAMDKFARYHTRRAIEHRKGKGAGVLLDPKLCLYYGNRLAHLPEVA